MLIELHLLTSHAPANLNRDDFGRPKTAYFGGTERARISSQSQKRAVRRSTYLKELLGDRLSTRSLHIPRDIYDRLKKDYSDGRLERLGLACEAVANALGKAEKVNKDDEYALKTSQIVFLTQQEIARIEQFVRETVESDTKLTKKELKEVSSKVAEQTGLNERPTDGVDMALFGRMTTDDENKFKAVDAAMQVAHPIATHTTVTETDYFTAVDDLMQQSGERGSGHIGEHDFNSAVFYKYFSCNLDQLVQNLGGDHETALEALESVFDSACRVTPSGKQNSFASHSQADVVLLVVRDKNVPCSLANAFERPVPASERGYLMESVNRLVRRYARLVEGYELDDSAVLFTLEETEANGPFKRAEKLSDVWAFLREHAGATALVEA